MRIRTRLLSHKDELYSMKVILEGHMPELTITSPYVHWGQSLTPTHLPWATICQGRLYPPVRDFGFGLYFQGLIRDVKMMWKLRMPLDFWLRWFRWLSEQNHETCHCGRGGEAMIWSMPSHLLFLSPASKCGHWAAWGVGVGGGGEGVIFWSSDYIHLTNLMAVYVLDKTKYICFFSISDCQSQHCHCLIILLFWLRPDS